MLTLRTARDAHARIRDARPDLIVLDIRMEHPDSGWRLLQDVRLARDLAPVPVILCSASTRDTIDRADDLRRHQAEVLAKPFSIDELLDLVGRLIGPAR